MRAFLFYAFFLLSTWPAAARDDAALINAASFALTGSDQGIQVVDLKKCIFRVGDKTFFLNNVHVDRIGVQKKTERYIQQRTIVVVQLHGAGTVLEEFIKASTYEDDDIHRFLRQQSPYLYEDRTAKRADDTFELFTDEYERVMKAWSFIYTHGCTGKRSAF
jgi:hypothetical protein